MKKYFLIAALLFPSSSYALPTCEENLALAKQVIQIYWDEIKLYERNRGELLIEIDELNQLTEQLEVEFMESAKESRTLRKSRDYWKRCYKLKLKGCK